MSSKSDFEIGGRLRARRLLAARPPDTMTIEEHVRVERKERWHRLVGPLASGETYEDVEIGGATGAAASLSAGGGGSRPIHAGCGAGASPGDGGELHPFEAEAVESSGVASASRRSYRAAANDSGVSSCRSACRFAARKA
jgi:hypothetical protein